MIRMILKFRSQKGAYGTVTKIYPAEKTTVPTWVLSELPAGSTLISTRFEASVLMPEDIVLIAAEAHLKAKSARGAELKPL